MENNEYLSIEVTEETRDWLILLGFNELAYYTHNDETPTHFIINKTKNQFWSNGERALSHANKMTTITPTTLNSIKQWQN